MKTYILHVLCGFLKFIDWTALGLTGGTRDRSLQRACFALMATRALEPLAQYFLMWDS